MTATMTENLPSVSDVLRGDRRRRPVADRSVAPGLRAELEDVVYQLARRAPRDTELTIRPGDVRESSGAAPSSSLPSVPRLRGALVSQLLRLTVVGHRVDDHFADAVAAWRAERDDGAALDLLDPDERARLATEVTAHGVTLAQRLDVVNPQWRPRTSVSIIQRLAGGVVVARDHLDLVVGTVDSPNASVALFDLTTSPLGAAHERVLRYHALMETLRSQVVPLRVVMMSSATGEIWSGDVDREMLRRGLDELATTIEREWVLR